jgi:hypothetical protein
MSVARDHTVSLFDARAFFEKALQHGLAHGIINQSRLQAMEDEAVKGLVQIARYFGSEYLRPELERARERLVNLISLHLQVASGGELNHAAELLRDHTLLSRSKAGSDLLKALIVMPQSSHLGMNERGAFSDRHIPQLARWSLASFADYQAEFQARQHAVLMVQAARWMAADLGLDEDTLHELAPDAEAVIRTALLCYASGLTEYPDWAALDSMLRRWRQQAAGKAGKTGTKKVLLQGLQAPAGLPESCRAVVAELMASIKNDLPKLLDAKISTRTLLDQTPAFMGRYFWLEDALSEVDQLDEQRSQAWNQLTKGHNDDATILTLLLGVCAGQAPKPSLTSKSAGTLVRRLRKQGWHDAPVQDWLRSHAPAHYLSDCQELWRSFSEHAQATLLSDRDTQLKEALTLLKQECNVGAS